MIKSWMAHLVHKGPNFAHFWLFLVIFFWCSDANFSSIFQKAHFSKYKFLYPRLLENVQIPRNETESKIPYIESYSNEYYCSLKMPLLY